MTTPRLKLFGTFRSGSNYVKALMELNYDVELLVGEGGFKHAPYPAIFHGNDYMPLPWPVVMTVKNPYSFLTSMWRYAQDIEYRNMLSGRDWSSFLRERLVIFDSSQPEMPRYRFANPIDYWNGINYNLLSLADDIRFVTRYEDALSEPGEVAEAMARRFGLIRTSAELVIPERHAQRMRDRHRSSGRRVPRGERLRPRWVLPGASLPRRVHRVGPGFRRALGRPRRGGSSRLRRIPPHRPGHSACRPR